MKKTIVETTTKTFDESYCLLATRINETYLLEPDFGMCLKHVPTGRVFLSGICVDSEYKISEYIEVEKV